MNNLSVVIVDDHALFRNGLRQLLESREIDVVGMTGNPMEAVDLVTQCTPDIVLLDIRMPKMGGLEVLEELRNTLPEQCVVILTTSVEEPDLLKALKLGATGYLLKDLELDALVNLLRQAKDGETVVAPDLTGFLARAVVTKDNKPKQRSAYNLTPREMEILRHIAMGKSNKDIAASLGIVDGTVKLHVRAVLKKLKVQTRVQAAVLAVSEQICENASDG